MSAGNRFSGQGTIDLTNRSCRHTHSLRARWLCGATTQPLLNAPFTRRSAADGLAALATAVGLEPPTNSLWSVEQQQRRGSSCDTALPFGGAVSLCCYRIFADFRTNSGSAN